MMVIDTRVVQCNEEDVGSSCRMEKEGLKRCLSFVKDNGLDVCELVTDRNPSIIKHMKDNMPGVKHSFDVWHVAKGLKKKLLKVSNTKGCKELSLWIRSIINHLYWTVVSTPEADGKLMLEKWQSLCNHLHNKHDHEGSAFTTCAHPPLEGPERRKKWLKEGSKVSVLTLDVLQSTYMLRDVPQLSTGPQTAAIEAFHSVLNHFAPKMIGFSYDGMVHRSILAAVHFNENSNRPQAQRKDGQLRYNVAFRKARKEFVVQGIKESCTFDYVQRLVHRVIRLASRCSLTDMEQRVLVHHHQLPVPPPMCASITKTNKEDAVQQHRSRYNKK